MATAGQPRLCVRWSRRRRAWGGTLFLAENRHWGGRDQFRVRGGFGFLAVGCGGFSRPFPEFRPGAFEAVAVVTHFAVGQVE